MDKDAGWWLKKHRAKPTFLILCEHCKEFYEISSEEYVEWWKDKKIKCKKCNDDVTEQPRIMI